MADFMMHHTFAASFSHIALQSAHHLMLGAQGPDYFFYAVNDPTKAMRIGHRLHNENTRAFLIAWLEYAIKHENPRLLDTLLGFLTHYALDITLHPYIYYYTGNYREDDASTHTYAGLHVQFENKVDIAFIKAHLNLDLQKQHVLKKVLPLKTLPKDIKDAMSAVSKTVYDEEDAGSLYAKGYRTMRLVYRLFIRDVTGLKRRLFTRILGYKKPKMVYLQDLSHAQRIDDFDYLNKNKLTWYHPVTNDGRQESVEQLYQEASTLAQSWIQLAKDAYTKKDASLLASLPNASYDTGLDLSCDQTMTHFKLYND